MRSEHADRAAITPWSTINPQGLLEPSHLITSTYAQRVSDGDGTTRTLLSSRYRAASLTQKNSRLLSSTSLDPDLPDPFQRLLISCFPGSHKTTGNKELLRPGGAHRRTAHVLVCTPGSKQPARNNSPCQQSRREEPRHMETLEGAP